MLILFVFFFALVKAVKVAPLVIGKKLLIAKKVLIAKKAAIVGKAVVSAAVVHHGGHLSNPIENVQTAVSDRIQTVQSIFLDRGSNVINEGAHLAGVGTKVVSNTLHRVGNNLQDHAVRVQALGGLLQNRFSQHEQVSGQVSQQVIQSSVQEPEPPQQVFRLKRDTESQNRQRNELQRLLRVVRQNKAEACLQRVLCELSVDMNVHGAEGAKFGNSVL